MSDLPGGQTYSQDEAILYWENLQAKEEAGTEQMAKKVRTRPNVSKYINDMIAQVSQHFNVGSSAPAPSNTADQVPVMTVGLSSHSIRRGAAAYANASPKLAIQWISTRGAWLLDSLTKAFAYVGTTTREDQSVGKVLAGFKDPDLPCATPTIRTLKHQLPDLEYALLATLRHQLFKNVTGFSDVSLNVAPDVLDAALASLLIHLEEVVGAVDKEREESGFTSHYIYRFHEAIAATNTALGSHLSMSLCVDWGKQLSAAWKTENFAQIGASCSGDSAVLTAAITQILNSISSIERTLSKLTLVQERQNALFNTREKDTRDQAEEQIVLARQLPAIPPDITPEASTLAGCVMNWFTYELWHAADSKKQQFLRADLKACVNIMLILGGTALHVPARPFGNATIAHELWKQTVWTLAENLDRATNDKLHAIDGKRRTKTAGSLRKRWSRLRASSRTEYDVLCSNFLALKSAGQIADDCTPPSHRWTARDLQ
ncbi:hypothetical protein Gpo141_00013900 [Globisporangium polare]